ncbi:AI-2E family transporter [Fodinicurvata sp. EGI_FJ10296]|uniref:AI-2E family transporter n=1 Tax=Fodinicurvata sp. EGI_FJ10296 TaxID=3231908 RepID=UPI00345139FF
MPSQTQSAPFAAIRYGVVLTALAAISIFVFWTASKAFLLVFAGILFAAFLDALTRLLGGAVPSWGRGIRLAIVCIVLAALFLAGLAWGSAAIAMQIADLIATLREQSNEILSLIEEYGPGIFGDSDTDGGGTIDRRSGSDIGPSALQSLMPNLQGLFGPAWTAIAVAGGVIGDAAIIIFLGIFFAAQPWIYRDAMLLLVPLSRRSHVRDVLDETGRTLRHWLLGQSITMSVIFLFTWGGLWLVGVGPAFALGLQAGLLAFVPTLGPLIAGFAIMLASISAGWPGIVGALVVYIGVQTLESYLLTPMIQRRAVHMPPAFIFIAQIVLGLLFGLYGLALATPLGAVARVFILHFYVEDTLGDDIEN